MEEAGKSAVETAGITVDGAPGEADVIMVPGPPVEPLIKGSLVVCDLFAGADVCESFFSVI